MRPSWRARARNALIISAVTLVGLPASASAQRGDDDPPDVWRAPTIAAATPYVGVRLTATGAAWSSRWPASASYLWLRCGSDSLWSCEIVTGQTASTYTLATRDLGKRIRAVVVVENRDGSDYAWSAPTAVVTSAPPPPPPPAPAPVPVPAPVVPVPAPAPVPVPSPPAVSTAPLKMMSPAAVVRIRGWLTGSGARITLLSVRAPKGATISVSCSGPSCPRSAPAQSTKVTRLNTFEGRLRAGTRLVIRVTRPGFLGKHTSIAVRRGKAPTRRDRCLYPGAKGPVACPA